MPRVVQKPLPPVWIAAISTEESFVYAAKNGFNLMIVPYAGKPGALQELVSMYRRVWKESGDQDGAEPIQGEQVCYGAEKRADAMAGFRPVCPPYLQTFGALVPPWEGKAPR